MGAHDYLTKNIKQYVNYSKYSADSSISFDVPADKPPDDKTKETVLPGQDKKDPPPPAKKGG